MKSDQNSSSASGKPVTEPCVAEFDSLVITANALDARLDQLENMFKNAFSNLNTSAQAVVASTQAAQAAVAQASSSAGAALGQATILQGDCTARLNQVTTKLNQVLANELQIVAVSHSHANWIRLHYSGNAVQDIARNGAGDVVLF